MQGEDSSSFLISSEIIPKPSEISLVTLQAQISQGQLKVSLVKSFYS